MNDKSSPSAGVQQEAANGVLFQRSQAEERVVPAEVKVMA